MSLRPPPTATMMTRSQPQPDSNAKAVRATVNHGMCAAAAHQGRRLRASTASRTTLQPGRAPRPRQAPRTGPVSWDDRQLLGGAAVPCALGFTTALTTCTVNVFQFGASHRAENFQREQRTGRLGVPALGQPADGILAGWTEHPPACGEGWRNTHPPGLCPRPFPRSPDSDFQKGSRSLKAAQQISLFLCHAADAPSLKTGALCSASFIGSDLVL